MLPITPSLCPSTPSLGDLVNGHHVHGRRLLLPRKPPAFAPVTAPRLPRRLRRRPSLPTPSAMPLLRSPATRATPAPPAATAATANALSRPRGPHPVNDAPRPPARPLRRRSAPTPALDDERIKRENLAMRQRLLDAKPRATTRVSAPTATASPTPVQASPRLPGSARGGLTTPTNGNTPAQARIPTDRGHGRTSASDAASTTTVAPNQPRGNQPNIHPRQRLPRANGNSDAPVVRNENPPTHGIRRRANPRVEPLNVGRANENSRLPAPAQRARPQPVTRTNIDTSANTGASRPARTRTIAAQVRTGPRQDLSAAATTRTPTTRTRTRVQAPPAPTPARVPARVPARTRGQGQGQAPVQEASPRPNGASSPTHVPRPRRHVTPALRDPKIRQANLEMRKRISEAKPSTKINTGRHTSREVTQTIPAPIVQTPSVTLTPETETEIDTETEAVTETETNSLDISNVSGTITVANTEPVTRSSSEVDSVSNDIPEPSLLGTVDVNDVDINATNEGLDNIIANIEGLVDINANVEGHVDFNVNIDGHVDLLVEAELNLPRADVSALASDPVLDHEVADDAEAELENKPESEPMVIPILPEVDEVQPSTDSSGTRPLTLDDLEISDEVFAKGNFGSVYLTNIKSSIKSFRNIRGVDEAVNGDPEDPTVMAVKVMELTTKQPIHTREVKSDGQHGTGSDTSNSTLSSSSSQADEDWCPALVERHAILAIPPHPMIITLHAVIEDEPANKLYLVTDVGWRGDLRRAQDKQLRGIFRERDARVYAASIALGLQHIHASGYAHRDMKPDNIVFGDDRRPKIIDFGFATKLGPGECSADRCGTLQYLAPEILLAKEKETMARRRRQQNTDQGEEVDIDVAGNDCQGFDQAVDWWSFGIMVYEMIVGSTPFQSWHWDRAEAKWTTERNIKRYGMGQTSLSFPAHAHVSPEARDFIGRLLDPNPDTRLGMNSDEELRNHPWFKGVDWAALLTDKFPRLGCVYR